jgi:hypothetical protein
MSELFYPTIDLFVYDLRSPLNADSAEIEENLKSFWARLPPNTQIKDVETEPEYLELIQEKDHTLNLNPANCELEGYLYPVRLNDVYGLQIDCSVNNLTEPQPIESLIKIQSEIEPNSHPNSLTIGQTWLISGWLTEPNQDAESLARDCYKAVLKKDQWTQELYGKGTFLNSNIFEIWQSQSYPNEHLIILLFPNQTMAEKAANFYSDWMGLFCYRHKITWAYHQSRLIKEALVNHYKKVEENAKIIKNSQSLETDLTRLQQLFSDIQNVLNKYTIDLLNLSFQKQIIDINLVNYRTRLELIRQKVGEGSDLKFFDKFSELAEKKYLTQIEKDNENMQLGLKLLETNINALRSQIELEKSQRDRSFQNIVTLVGTGTAIATILDYEGKTCKAIFGVPKDTKDTSSHFCGNFFVGGVVIPVTLLILLGGAALFLKWLYIKIK